MVDKLTREKRSEVMSKIRSKSGLDRKLFSILDHLQIPYRKYPEVEGSPDAAVGKTMVFAQGGFWHGCPRHYREPKSSFRGVDWRVKIKRNRRRDREVDRLLRKEGLGVLRVWEHDVEGNPNKVRRLLLKARAKP